MPDAAPFLFDHEFPSSGPGSASEKAQRRYSAEDLAAARAEGVGEGKDQALRQAARDADHQAASALSAIAAALRELTADLANQRQRSAVQTLEAAHAMVRALFPVLHARTAPFEIAALAEQMVAARGPEARLTVHVHPDIQAALEARLAARQIAGTGAAIAIVADPTLAGGDCRLDWPGGGAVRDAEELWQRIDEAFAAVLEEATAR